MSLRSAGPWNPCADPNWSSVCHRLLRPPVWRELIARDEARSHRQRLGWQTRRETENREEPLDIQEEADAGDLVARDLEHLQRPRVEAAVGGRSVLGEGRRGVGPH